MKTKIYGVTFFGSGAFSVSFLVSARSGSGEKGNYEGFGYVFPYKNRGTYGNLYNVGSSDFRDRLVAAVKSGREVDIIYDYSGRIFDIK